MPKRPLSGTAGAGRDRKIARLHDDLIETELKRLDTRADSGTASTPDAITKLQSYEKSQENDKTDSILLQLLQALPDDGKANLAQDIVGRDDKDLEELGNDVKMFLFSFCTGTSIPGV